MDAYTELRLRPQPEMSVHHLMSAVFGRLHLALVRSERQDIGVSFPEHGDRPPGLGAIMRLHGRREALDSLEATGWTKFVRDYAQTRPVADVPEGCMHRVVSRVQAKSGVDRLRRRAMRRHDIDATEAARRIPVEAAEQLALPFMILGSRSTGQPSFPLFIRHGPLLSDSRSGTFSTYGLSAEATIPWF
ncbi:type I-F CRISPR-associated endoribonuclease Cas6/Csy4 [Piscinibacter sakaiensis]|uniref:CRISPR-associated protein, Csy4 family n=1 Tax=Piscinibacter sakaiensis TaxID=1547922 RepID=A0A0K8P6A2_PISS1|nr:type I-F CRISPR-associated endoribonuclease Cas6/Csy4 [Piscinibacter sakaiensis]GAP37740.1 CRISPR-associated protein, Csy4 family [Piscinibacter sakaiensis]